MGAPPQAQPPLGLGSKLTTPSSLSSNSENDDADTQTQSSGVDLEEEVDMTLMSDAKGWRGGGQTHGGGHSARAHAIEGETESVLSTHTMDAGTVGTGMGSVATQRSVEDNITLFEDILHPEMLEALSINL